MYGSIAAGNEQSDSDIDLIVVGHVSPADLALPLRRAGNCLGGRLTRPSIRPRGGAALRATMRVAFAVLTSFGWSMRAGNDAAMGLGYTTIEQNRRSLLAQRIRRSTAGACRRGGCLASSIPEDGRFGALASISSGQPSPRPALSSAPALSLPSMQSFPRAITVLLLTDLAA